MVGRLVHKVDFERVLACRSLTRSAHFALHHLSGSPQVRKPAPTEAAASKLSTVAAPQLPQAVDDFEIRAPAGGHWLGCVVPKRHARRAVTRSLLKRQIRIAFERHAAALPGGLWLVRLRAPFARTEFISARSARLAAAAKDELERLLALAAG